MPRLSDEQITQARCVDLLSYLQFHELGNIRKVSADVYSMAEHDSMRISNGKWFRHSAQYGGHSALDFLIKVRGIPFVEAVESLAGGAAPSSHRDKPESKIQPAEYKSTSTKPFILPTPNKNNDRVTAYLRGRGICKDIINHCIKVGLLYESINHRCVLVGKDDNGIAKFACERGTADDRKKDISGGSKKFSFTLPPDNHSSDTLAVFESPVDCLAHHTIHDIGQTGWDGHHLSLSGVNSTALSGFLERRQLRPNPRH